MPISNPESLIELEPMDVVSFVGMRWCGLHGEYRQPVGMNE